MSTTYVAFRVPWPASLRSDLSGMRRNRCPEWSGMAVRIGRNTHGGIRQGRIPAENLPFTIRAGIARLQTRGRIPGEVWSFTPWSPRGRWLVLCAFIALIGL